MQVREAQRFTRVWLDVYAFDRDGALVCFDIHDLTHVEPAPGGAEVFVMDAPVWGPRLVPTSGAPAPERIKYRVYVRPHAGLFTDRLLHDLTLPAPTRRPTRRGRG